MQPYTCFSRPSCASLTSNSLTCAPQTTLMSGHSLQYVPSTFMIVKPTGTGLPSGVGGMRCVRGACQQEQHIRHIVTIIIVNQPAPAAMSQHNYCSSSHRVSAALAD